MKKHPLTTSGARTSRVDLSPEAFKTLGYQLVDRIAEYYQDLPALPLTTGKEPETIRSLLGQSKLPEKGMPAEEILQRAQTLLFENSLLDGHPRFWGYIIGSGTPIGVLADMLAAAINPNMGGWALSPMATEIEAQTIRWIADLIGYHDDCGGILVSGGAMANYVGFLAGRKAKGHADIRQSGLALSDKQMLIYCSKETHTWIEKAADLFGHGTRAIRWVQVREDKRMDTQILAQTIENDLADGHRPFMVVGTAGSVSTGIVDDLDTLADICAEHGLWFHVDGAYGAFAAAVPEYQHLFQGLHRADSIALDPHKWLYTPLEAGCVLTRDPQVLLDAFSYKPPYYHFEAYHGVAPVNYYEYGMQNSRGFRALKVWMSLLHGGRENYIQMIGDDIRLSEMLYNHLQQVPDVETKTQNLSITTFRYFPVDLRESKSENTNRYLNLLNEKIMEELQKGGQVFVTNAMLDDEFVLRACIVNFRTQPADIDLFIDLFMKTAKKLDAAMRPGS